MKKNNKITKEKYKRVRELKYHLDRIDWVFCCIHNPLRKETLKQINECSEDVEKLRDGWIKFKAEVLF